MELDTVKSNSDCKRAEVTLSHFHGELRPNGVEYRIQRLYYRHLVSRSTEYRDCIKDT